MPSLELPHTPSVASNAHPSCEHRDADACWKGIGGGDGGGDGGGGDGGHGGTDGAVSCKCAVSMTMYNTIHHVAFVFMP